MKRRIKTIYLKDGKQIFYPSDAELKEIWDYVDKIDIEESYTIEEWRSKFVVIRSFGSDIRNTAIDMAGNSQRTGDS